jgi:hypothetical protein
MTRPAQLSSNKGAWMYEEGCTGTRTPEFVQSAIFVAGAATIIIFVSAISAGSSGRTPCLCVNGQHRATGSITSGRDLPEVVGFCSTTRFTRDRGCDVRESFQG